MMAFGQGPFTKSCNLVRTEREELESAMVLGSSNLHGLLGRLVQRNFDRSGLRSLLNKGALEVHKEHRRQQVSGVRHTL